MLSEKIEKLLNSKDYNDNEIGWELVRKEKVSLNDIQDYLEKGKIPVSFRYKYYWDFEKNKFVRNEDFDNEDANY